MSRPPGTSPPTTIPRGPRASARRPDPEHARSSATAGALGALLFLLSAPGAAAQDVDGAPSFREVVGLNEVDAAAVSPGGTAVAYRVRRTDWSQNRFDSEIWLAEQGSPTIQLTRTEGGSSWGARWSPDGRWIAFLADRAGDGAPQLYAIRPDGGEAHPLTSVEEGVRSFAWGPYGLELAVALEEPPSDRRKRLEERYGAWEVEGASHRTTHLWRLDLRAALRTDGGASRPPDTAAAARRQGERRDGAGDAPLRRLTGGGSFTVGSFAFGPRGERLAFDHRPGPTAASRSRRDLSMLDLESGELRPLVERPGSDGRPVWSPRGDWILFETEAGDTTHHENSELARVRAAGGEPELLTAGFDGEPDAVAWLPDGKGIRFAAWERTSRKLYRLEPGPGAISAVADSPRVLRSVSYSEDGERVAFIGERRRRLPEVYRTGASDWDPAALTSMTGQIQGWPVGRQEVVSWESEDGTTVEGVLIYPPDHDPTRRHPLVVRIRGGGSAVDHPSLAAQYGSHVYPLTQWLARGAVVLMPNHRGTVGYGQEFRALNARNPGIVARRDVTSGVDHLIDEGLVHPDSMVAVGWGRGGYVSALLATTTERFRAVSVGAGIAHRATHHPGTDIAPFTRRYPGATPWEGPGICDETSPIHHRRDAATPILIQRGAEDAGVPILSARQLYRGLKDVGVETRLIVYGGSGHTIGGPKELLAANWHNWQWVARWLWGQKVPELPVSDGSGGE